ncbi:MAG: PH domain-containing protein [Thermoanaerobaculia bacterium]
MGIEDQLQPGEEILYRARVTRLTLALWFALLAAGLIMAAVSWFVWQSVPGALTALAFAAVAGAVLLWKNYVLSSYDYVLTNHRIVMETGILSRRSMDSRLDKVNNVEHRQTLWGRLFNYGEVEIDTASETGAAVFRNISNPLEFKRYILGAAEDYRTASRMPLAAPAGPSGAERLRQLKALLDDGLISREEFEAKRQQLVQDL